ncbi:TRAP transporter small permease [Salipiger sp. PrR002]|uniref:TRAP transporter small permease n=1 Tax=Salipiger sp. PrR002 TaxID=2706489 RepID=UPI0013B7CD86|nr:TRAP transporter small permease [Salipiger sp. PrR002]NDW01529.1 TRAP transporter small permease [Salipiger sp. PrR002]NDW58236.1 TRAP transporter small permease [Salipiger sp. PrR004]
MTKLFSGLHRATLWLCATLAVAIIGALSVQIVSRYVFNAPVHMTDDIAEISLIWMTFLGAALVYREGGHIGLDVMSSVLPAAAHRALRVALHVLVIAVLAYVLTQVRQLQPLMSRLEFGTIPNGPLTSKFMLILLPFGLGAAMTILFALEAIWAELRGEKVEADT